MEFTLTANTTFQADDINDAFLRLAAHFEFLAGVEEFHLEPEELDHVGEIEISSEGG